MSKEEMIVPFSNGSAFCSWKACNCDLCVKYENKSETIDKAKCRLAFHIDFGTLNGEIPLRAAKMIGYDNGYLTDCKRKLTEKKKRVKKIKPIDGGIFNDNL
jgi:di/tripeptidase